MQHNRFMDLAELFKYLPGDLLGALSGLWVGWRIVNGTINQMLETGSQGHPLYRPLVFIMPLFPVALVIVLLAYYGYRAYAWLKP